MNKVYSCAFLSALDKNTSRVLFHVHVLGSGDEISSSTHSSYITLALIWLLWVETKNHLVETDGRRGRVFVCWGTRVSSAIGCYKNRPGPLLRTCGLAPDWRDTFECLSMMAAAGLSVPVRVCTSCSDRHNWLHIRVFGKDDWPCWSDLLFVIIRVLFVPLSFSQSLIWFFSSLQAIFMTLIWGGGMNQSTTFTENKTTKKNKKKSNWLIFFYLKAKLLTRFGTKVEPPSAWPAFVLFTLV